MGKVVTMLIEKRIVGLCDQTDALERELSALNNRREQVIADLNAVHGARQALDGILKDLRGDDDERDAGESPSEEAEEG